MFCMIAWDDRILEHRIGSIQHSASHRWILTLWHFEILRFWVLPFALLRTVQSRCLVLPWSCLLPRFSPCWKLYNLVAQFRCGLVSYHGWCARRAQRALDTFVACFTVLSSFMNRPFVPLALKASYQRTQIEPSNDQTVFHQNHQLCPKLPKLKVASPLKSGYNREWIRRGAQWQGLGWKGNSVHIMPTNPSNTFIYI